METPARRHRRRPPPKLRPPEGALRGVGRDPPGEWFDQPRCPLEPLGPAGISLPSESARRELSPERDDPLS